MQVESGVLNFTISTNTIRKGDGSKTCRIRMFRGNQLIEETTAFIDSTKVDEIRSYIRKLKIQAAAGRWSRENEKL